MFTVIVHTPTDDINCPGIDAGPVAADPIAAIHAWKDSQLDAYASSGGRPDDWSPDSPDSFEDMIIGQAADLERLVGAGASYPIYVWRDEQQVYLTKVEVAENGWLPISAAPTDGTLVDLYLADGRREVDCAFISGRWGRTEWRGKGSSSHTVTVRFGVDATHFRFAPPPPTAASDDAPVYEIEHMLCGTTGHVTDESRKALDAGGDALGLVVFQKKDYGWYIYVNPCAEEQALTDDAGDDIRRLCAKARSLGCHWVMLDQACDEIEGLDTYEWPTGLAA